MEGSLEEGTSASFGPNPWLSLVCTSPAAGDGQGQKVVGGRGADLSAADSAPRLAGHPCHLQPSCVAPTACHLVEHKSPSGRCRPAAACR